MIMTWQPGIEEQSCHLEALGAALGRLCGPIDQGLGLGTVRIRSKLDCAQVELNSAPQGLGLQPCYSAQEQGDGPCCAE